MKEEKYYNFKEILEFIGLDYEFEKANNVYPFNRKKDEIMFSWGQILIPKYGIKEMVQNKISDNTECPISELHMMYQVPFKFDDDVGLINKNISLTFRYDKAYKYGEVTKSIYECCFWILENAIKTNDFYIIKGDLIQQFFSYYIINNQWGLGRLTVTSPPCEKFI